MERIKFITKIYRGFIINYLLIRFFVMYAVAYIVVNIKESYNEGKIHNPFISYIVKETKKIQEIDNQYYLKYKINNEIFENEITLNSYNTIKRDVNKNIKGFSNYNPNTKEEMILNKNQIVKVYEKDNRKYIKTIKKEKLNSKIIEEKHLYHIKNIYSDFIFMFLMLVGLIYYVYTKYKKFHSLMLLPYDKNVFSTFSDKENATKQYDYFKGIKKIEGIEKNYFENKSRSNFDIYFNDKENIKQYLSISQDGFLDIERRGTKGVYIYKTPLKNSIVFKKSDLKKEKIYLGLEKGNKKKYLDIKDLTHTIGVGETGSGKSVFENLFLTSIFYNKEMFEKIYLIDFKVVEFKIYEKVKNVKLITDSKDLLDFRRELHQIMKDRLNEMATQGLRTSKRKYIWIQTDEFGELVNNTLEKEEKEELKTLLVDLGQKCRRTNMRFRFFGQKRDTENIWSNLLRNITTRICLGTENDDNITKIGGSKESLEKISLSKDDIKEFKHGRGIFKEGRTKNRYLFQSRFIDLDNNDEHRKIWEEVTEVKLLPKVEEEIEIEKKEINLKKEEVIIDIKIEKKEINLKKDSIKEEIKEEIENKDDFFDLGL